MRRPHLLLLTATLALGLLSSAMTLAPQDSMTKNVLFRIPKGAPTGTATLKVHGWVTSGGGGDVDRDDRFDGDQDTFAVTL